MRYKIRRIAPWSAIRTGCLLGWLIALGPALCIAVLAIQILQRIAQTLGEVAPLDITILGQPITSIDLLNLLGLSTTAQTVGELVERLPIVFGTLVLILVLIGALLIAGAILLVSLGYNLLGAFGAGIEIELRQAE